MKHIRVPVEPEPGDEPWGPVSHTKGTSIVNASPGLLSFYNSGRAFGIPGTVTGDFWERTQVTGDWNGCRTMLAQKGVFFDLYTTSGYQRVISGGYHKSESFMQNAQLSLNIDTARAGLWSGGLIHLTGQARFGSLGDKTGAAGTYAPIYTGKLYPDLMLDNDVDLTEFFLLQSITPEFSVVLGRISTVFMPDATFFGNSYKYYFSNFNFNKNPMTTNTYGPVSLSMLLQWAPTDWLQLIGGICDANGKANNLARDAFDALNYYFQATATYRIGGLPGRFLGAWNWSNKHLVDFSRPLGAVAPGNVVPVREALLSGRREKTNLAEKNSSWILIGSLAQWLYTCDDEATIAMKQRSSLPLRGIGVFGRFGYAPPKNNRVTTDASVTLFAHGMVPKRPNDTIGAGYFYNKFSGDLKDRFKELNRTNLRDESGVEAFYDFALTPAVHLTTSYQYIKNPFEAQTKARFSRHASVLSVRLGIDW